MLIDAMAQSEHEPAIRSVLTGANATIQWTGEKKSQQQDRKQVKSS
jgi:hypothetical protein